MSKVSSLVNANPIIQREDDQEYTLDGLKLKAKKLDGGLAGAAFPVRLATSAQPIIDPAEMSQSQEATGNADQQQQPPSPTKDKGRGR